MINKSKDFVGKWKEVSSLCSHTKIPQLKKNGFHTLTTDFFKLWNCNKLF